MNPLKQEEPCRAGLEKLEVEQRVTAEIDGCGKRCLHVPIDCLHRVGRIADVGYPKREVFNFVRHHLTRHAIRDHQANVHGFRLTDRVPQGRLKRLDIERADDLRQLRQGEARITQIELLSKEDARLSGSKREAEHDINPYVGARKCS
ncbi:hypothetical protein AWB81_06346 [Caballeronia arationis]|nr:hypothetical protein AWB81_06346 [Caballeronia arationis]